MATRITEHYVLDSGHHAIQEGATCGICADPLQVGQKAIEVPFDPAKPKWLVTVHLSCGIDSNDVEI